MAKKSGLPKYHAGFSFQVLLLATTLIAIVLTMLAFTKGTEAERAQAANSPQEVEYFYIYED
jgi:hypothetical protein